MIIVREMEFDATHSHQGMLVEPSHGHRYRVGLAIRGEPNSEGFICDFRAVKRIFNKVVGVRLQGSNLDGLLEFPTSENLSKWIWNELAPFFPLYYVEVREKPHSSVRYFGPHSKAGEDV